MVEIEFIQRGTQRKSFVQISARQKLDRAAIKEQKEKLRKKGLMLRVLGEGCIN